MKRYVFVISEGQPGGRLFAYARRALPGVPEYALREAFRKRDVKVNGQRVGMEAPLIPGAEVCLYTRETEGKAIPIVYEDDRLLVVIKPAGVSCEPDAKGGQTLPQMLCAQLRRDRPETAEPLLCHRLDNPTAGLLVLAKTPQAQLAMQNAFREHQVHKEYTCLVRGTPHPAHAVLSAWLQKDARRACVRVTAQPEPGAKSIVTEYTVLEVGECARLRIRLHTGRTHQIRAHMAYIGHPLLGDDQYGDRAFNKQQKCRALRLCATSLQFDLEGSLAYLNGKRFTCPPGF